MKIQMLISFHLAKITHSSINSQGDGYIVESSDFDMPQLGGPGTVSNWRVLGQIAGVGVRWESQRKKME